jgi:hypothetical protein
LAELGQKLTLFGRIKTSQIFDDNLPALVVTLTALQWFIIFSIILCQSIEKCLLYPGKKRITLSDIQNSSYSSDTKEVQFCGRIRT